jgi:hypothetical protein
MDSTYKCILDNLYDDVYCVDRERKITYWNKEPSALPATLLKVCSSDGIE